MPRKALGRGIDALLPGGVGSDRDTREVEVRSIRPGKYQPRRVMDEARLTELAQSIKEHGVVQPVVVRPSDDGYELVAGERRWRAAQMAGLSVIPAIIREFSDGEAMEIGLIENLQREDLNPIEQAEAYATLMGEFGLTQDDVAKRLGTSRPQVANTVRLLGLSEKVREWVRDGSLSMGHAKVLLSLPTPMAQDAFGELVVEKELSVRALEQEVVRATQSSAPEKKRRAQAPVDPAVQELEDRLRLALGTQVRLQAGKGRGKVVIEYYSQEDLERIIEVILADRASRALRGLPADDD